MDLVEDVYRSTKAFLKEELFGLCSQLRHAAVSVPSNIAEGQSRTSREFVHFLTMARGSFSEIETQILIAADGSRRTAEVGKLTNGLSRSIEKLATGHRPLATAI